MRLVFLGPPGCGKGTQSGLLCNQFGLVHLSSGDLLREACVAGTELGRAARALMEAGQLVPDELVLAMVLEKLKEVLATTAERGFILDGFPRTLAQAQKLDAMLANEGIQLTGAVEFRVTEEVILERLAGRWIHAPSGRSYHTIHCPPKVPGKDDVTGEALIQRSDDNEATVRRRLAVYHRQTEAICSYYAEQNILISVDANLPPRQVYHQIKKGLQERSTSTSLNSNHRLFPKQPITDNCKERRTRGITCAL
jgi:adenylate kinase